MTKKRKKDVLTPEKDERIGKLFILRKAHPQGIPMVDVITDRGTKSRYFSNKDHFLFLGLGKTTGRRFKSGYSKGGGSQRIHKFLLREEIIEVTIFPGEFDAIFRRLSKNEL